MEKVNDLNFVKSQDHNMDKSETSNSCSGFRNPFDSRMNVRVTKGQIRSERKTATSHLCNNCHKMCRRGLVVQSLARFDSKDPAVPIDGELGEWGGLIT